MIAQYEDYQKLGRQGIEVTLRSFTTFSKGFQAVASETAGFLKTQLDGGAAAFDKLAGVKTFDKAVEVQADFLKQSFDGLVDHSTRVSHLVAELAREAASATVPAKSSAVPASAKASK
jgi:hypothetical protein